MTTELSSFFQQYLPHLFFVLNRFASIETFVRLYYRIYDYLNSRGLPLPNPHFDTTHFLCQAMLAASRFLMSSASIATRGMATSVKPFNRLVLVRHGESQWNKENRFTGWYDVPLSDKGICIQIE